MTTLPILLYHGDNIDKTIGLYSTLNELGYDYKVISDENLSQTLGYLIGLENFSKNDTPSDKHFPIDLMILPPMEQEEISRVSKILKEKEVDIARKAMLTEHNRHWSIETLIDEINEEHYYFAKRLELQTLVMECIKVSPDKVPENIRSSFQQTVVECYELLKKQSEIKPIEDAVGKILPLYEQVKDLIIYDEVR